MAKFIIEDWMTEVDIIPTENSAIDPNREVTNLLAQLPAIRETDEPLPDHMRVQA